MMSSYRVVACIYQAVLHRVEPPVASGVICTETNDTNADKYECSHGYYYDMSISIQLYNYMYIMHGNQCASKWYGGPF